LEHTQRNNDWGDAYRANLNIKKVDGNSELECSRDSLNQSKLKCLCNSLYVSTYQGQGSGLVDFGQAEQLGVNDTT
jgi:hypothetical protein